MDGELLRATWSRPSSKDGFEIENEAFQNVFTVEALRMLKGTRLLAQVCTHRRAVSSGREASLGGRRFLMYSSILVCRPESRSRRERSSATKSGHIGGELLLFFLAQRHPISRAAPRKCRGRALRTVLKRENRRRIESQAASLLGPRGHSVRERCVAKTGLSASRRHEN